MSLVVDRIRCVEESDEIGADSIYLVVFRGNSTAPFGTGVAAVGPGFVWDDFDTGETVNTDINLAQTNASAVYAVMIVEKDHATDISGTAVLGAWKSSLDIVWRSVMLGFAAGGLSTTSATAKQAGFDAIRNAMNGLSSVYMEFPFGNDDVIAVRRVTIVTPGTSQGLRFRSDEEDATYDVTFKQTAAV